MKKFLCFVGVLGILEAGSLLVFFSNVWAKQLYVPSGSYTTIQAAINAATNGDTVCVNDGTYTENINVKSEGSNI